MHGTVSSASHAINAHVRSLAAAHGGISVATFYSKPAATEAVGATHGADGFVTIEWLLRNTSIHPADVYLCGPKAFLRTFVSGLPAAGVRADRIRYEFFGPADELFAA